MAKKKKKGSKSDIGGGSTQGTYEPKDWEYITGPKAPKAKRKGHDVDGKDISWT